jgi:phenylacetate-CoA ligase
MYPALMKKIVAPLADRIKGSNIMKHLRDLEKSQWYSPDQLEELQRKKLRLIIQHSYNNVPYYHKIFRELDLKPNDIKTVHDLSKLPVLTKEIVRNNTDNLVAGKKNVGELIESCSSGSTGEPLKYYLTQESHDLLYAAAFRGWGWAGYSMGDKIVNLAGFPYQMIGKSKLSKRFAYAITRHQFLQAFNLDENTIDRYIEFIRKYKPKVIQGYSSSVYLLAKALKKYEIHDIQPHAIITHGETLSREMRQTIENQFGCNAFDGYGGEGMLIAMQCGVHDGYHLTTENLVVEFIKQNEYVSAGELGEIVLTNLTNYGMPFIRYKIGDAGKPSDDTCSCGRGLPLMQSIEGRVPDMIITPSGKVLIVHFFTGLFEYIEGVDQFQILQRKTDELIVRLAKNSKFDDTDEAQIIKEIQGYAGDDMEIIMEFVEEIPVSSSGKRRFVISKVAEEQF